MAFIVSPVTGIPVLFLPRRDYLPARIFYDDLGKVNGALVLVRLPRFREVSFTFHSWLLLLRA